MDDTEPVFIETMTGNAASADRAMQERAGPHLRRSRFVPCGCDTVAMRRSHPVPSGERPTVLRCPGCSEAGERRDRLSSAHSDVAPNDVVESGGRQFVVAGEGLVL